MTGKPQTEVTLRLDTQKGNLTNIKNIKISLDVYNTEVLEKILCMERL